MSYPGIVLGMCVALLWASADTIAAFAARRVGTFNATVVSQSSGLLALCLMTYQFSQEHGFSIFVPSAILLGVLTGFCAAIGYLACYKALALGPLALVSPLTSTSSAVTLFLSCFLLHEPIAPLQIIASLMILCGVILATSDLKACFVLFLQHDWFLRQSGIALALLTALAFGGMDFGIGASTSLSNWFLPVLWTRFFSLLFLLLFWCFRKWQPFHKRRSVLSTEKALDMTGGLLLAISAGLAENVAVLSFSIDTALALTGIASILACSYSLLIMLFGIVFEHERLHKAQLSGIFCFMLGLFLLWMFSG